MTRGQPPRHHLKYHLEFILQQLPWLQEDCIPKGKWTLQPLAPDASAMLVTHCSLSPPCLLSFSKAPQNVLSQVKWSVHWICPSPWNVLFHTPAMLYAGYQSRLWISQFLTWYEVLLGHPWAWPYACKTEGGVQNSNGRCQKSTQETTPISQCDFSGCYLYKQHRKYQREYLLPQQMLNKCICWMNKQMDK